MGPRYHSVELVLSWDQYAGTAEADESRVGGVDAVDIDVVDADYAGRLRRDRIGPAVARTPTTRKNHTCGNPLPARNSLNKTTGGTGQLYGFEK